MTTPVESTDTPTDLGLDFEPDWAESVFSTDIWSTTNFRSRNRSAQRTAFRRTPKKSMRYTVPASRTSITHKDTIGQLDVLAQGPVRVPWWPDGLRIDSMASVDSVTLEIEPAANQGMDAGDVILVHDEVREISSRTGSTLTLVTEGGTSVQAAGAWVYPMRVATFWPSEQTAAIVRHDRLARMLRFETI